MPRGIYEGNKGHVGNGKSGADKGPIIFRPCSFELVKAITVHVAKECKSKTITPEIILTTVYVLRRLCERQKIDKHMA